MNEAKRKQNEQTFETWTDTATGGRRYWYDVKGRFGWKARYLKEVDREETTLSFWQEIYNEEGKLVEVHRKYPVDLGHTLPDGTEKP